MGMTGMFRCFALRRFQSSLTLVCVVSHHYEKVQCFAEDLSLLFILCKESTVLQYFNKMGYIELISKDGNDWLAFATQYSIYITIYFTHSCFCLKKLYWPKCSRHSKTLLIHPSSQALLYAFHCPSLYATFSLKCLNLQIIHSSCWDLFCPQSLCGRTSGIITWDLTTYKCLPVCLSTS